MSLFWAAIMLTHIPAVYGRALTNDYLHEAEHALYLLTALLVWAPLIGADPLPHQLGARSELVCMTACMLPMVLIALWLAATPTPVYGHYVVGRGSEALRDQRLAATIMGAGGLPACALAALAGARLPQRRRRREPRPHEAAA